jgi:hypothetical protein
MILPLLLTTLALPPTMPPADIRPGQHGECRTVFEGDTIEAFTFEVKGLMKHFLGPQKDLILVKLTSPKAEFTGVVAGMSGSPCTIDGKVIGALSYAFATFAKEAIAGVTPIASMLEIMDLPDEARPWRLAADSSPSEPPKHATHRPQAATPEDWDALKRGAAPVSTGPSGDEHSALRPILTPLSLGGVPAETLRQFAPWLESAGFVPVSGGVGGGSDAGGQAVAKALVPGSAVSGLLIGGDMDVAATGTVSWVDKDMVLAFGHPFFGAGAVSVPMANATILNTMVSSMRSFKMSSTGALVGEITQDRLTAIGGYMGRHPKRIPIHGSITTPRGKQTFVLQIARDVAMTPRLVAMGISGALGGRADASERGTVRLEGRISVQGHEPVHVHNIYTADRDSNLMGAAGIDMGRTFQMLWDSPFGPPEDVRIDVDVVLESEPKSESIEAIYADKAQVQPGESVALAVRLRRRGAPIDVARFEVPIPRAWAGQKIAFAALGAEAAERLVRELSGQPKALEYAQIVRFLDHQRPEGHIYVMAIREGVGLHAAIDNLSFVPPSTVALMSGDPTKEARRMGVAWETHMARPGTVDGMARTSVLVTKVRH